MKMTSRYQFKTNVMTVLLMLLLATLPSIVCAQSFGTIQGPNDRPSLSDDRQEQGGTTIINNNYYPSSSYPTYQLPYNPYCYDNGRTPQTGYQINYRGSRFGVSIGTTYPNARPYPPPPSEWNHHHRPPPTRAPAGRRLPSTQELRAR